MFLNITISGLYFLHISVLFVTLCTIFSVMYLICINSWCLFKEHTMKSKDYSVLCLQWFLIFYPAILLCWTEVALIVSEQRQNKLESEGNLMDNDEHFSSCNFWKAVNAPCTSLSLFDDVPLTNWLLRGKDGGRLSYLLGFLLVHCPSVAASLSFCHTAARVQEKVHPVKWHINLVTTVFVHSWQSTKYSLVFFPLEIYLIVKSFLGVLNLFNK